MPLNKYVAHAGICGRREAADLVKAGHVTVNGDIVYEPGYKVTANDKITVKNKPVHLQKNLVYILINKPKDYITTAKDPEGRKTVFDLVAHATKERIYPVGRLDRNTTGVLLMTNDGELAQKLTHPSFEIKKVYEVKLDKPLVKKDFDAILNGVTLEDGFVQADSLGYADAKDKSVIGIEIHSGRNRIVRRLFEHLGYDVRNLDRVMFANLTKKNVERGKWRLLNEKEVRLAQIPEPVVCTHQKRKITISFISNLFHLHVSYHLGKRKHFAPNRCLDRHQQTRRDAQYPRPQTVGTIAERPPAQRIRLHLYRSPARQGNERGNCFCQT